MSGTGDSTWREFTQDISADLERAATLLRDTSAIHDPLTGLASAAYLELRLREETARSVRMQIPFSLIALSMFSNTGSGAGISDTLVRDTAVLLRSSLRAMDVVARVGRLDFTCLIPEAGAEQAAIVTARLTNVVGSQAERLAGIRIVAGTATFPDDGVDAATLLSAARLALLRTHTAGVTRRAPFDNTSNAGSARQIAAAADTTPLSPATRPAPTPVPKDQAAALRSVAEAAAEAALLHPVKLVAGGNQAQPTPPKTRKRQINSPSQQPATPANVMAFPQQQATETPVAVGFISGGRFPVSFWHGEELVPIEAVLEEHMGQNETQLLVQTGEGLMQLTCRGRHWYISEWSGTEPDMVY